MLTFLMMYVFLNLVCAELRNASGPLIVPHCQGLSARHLHSIATLQTGAEKDGFENYSFA